MGDAKMVPVPTPDDALSLHADAQALLAELLARFPMPPPAVEWRRYRTTAGMAFFERWTIALSIHVVIDRDRLEETLVHEFAHLLAYHRHGRAGRGHGPAWRQAMLDLGKVPETKHRYACRRNRPRQVVVYECAACGEKFERARRLPRRRQYQHVGCGGQVRFVAAYSA